MKRIAVVPTLLTLGNGVCGFVAITWASKVIPGETPENVDWCFAMTGWFLIFAMFFDMLDGYVARLSKTASKFGGELDSLCDAISFGVAPAFLLLKMGPDWSNAFMHQLVAGIAAIYMSCVLLRLARFNVDNNPDPASHKRFRGLPSPGAAGCLASLAILRGSFPKRLATEWLHTDIGPIRDGLHHLLEIVAPMAALLVALLMVSLVSYPHITKQVFRGKRHPGHIIQLLMATLIIILVRDLALVLIFWGYAFVFPVRGLIVQALGRAPAPQLDDLSHT